MPLKIMCNPLFRKGRNLTKTLLIMKFVAIFLFVACMQVSATELFAKTQHFAEPDVSLKKIFREIESQSGYQFLYKDKVLRKIGNVSISVTNASVQEVLDQCFKNQPLTYTILDKIIVVKAKEEKEIVGQPEPIQKPLPIEIQGTVKGQGRGSFGRGIHHCKRYAERHKFRVGWFIFH